MTDHDSDRDDGLAAALRQSLEARDRAHRAPPFARMWSADRAGGSPFGCRYRLTVAATLTIAVAIAWTSLERRAQAPPAETYTSAHVRIDPLLAHQLSSTEFWRVPTDGLLAFAAPPLRADLPMSTDFEVSLEESLL